jgi:hypothetical protein
MEDLTRAGAPERAFRILQARETGAWLPRVAPAGSPRDATRCPHDRITSSGMMGAVSGASHVVFRIAYARYSDLRDDVTQQMERGGLLVRVQDASALGLDSPVVLELVLPDGTRLQDAGTVLQVFAGFGIAVSVGAELVERARRAANGFDPPGAAPPRHERIDLAAPPPRRTAVASRTMEPLAPPPSARPFRAPAASHQMEPLASPRGTRSSRPTPPPGASDQPSHHASRHASQHASQRSSEPVARPRGTLDPEQGTPRPDAGRAEKIQRALHGTRDERNAILRDRDRTLHPFVLKNPQLNAEDVATIAKNAQMTSDLLQQIAERKEWFQRPAIALALARNPKTPPDLAVRALEHVPLEALRQMAKGVGVLPHVTQAARKKILG